MSIKSKITVTILVLLCLLLLTGVFYNNKRVSYYKNEYENITARFYDVTGSGKLLNMTTHLYRPIYIDTNIIKTKNPFSLLAIFDDKGCSVCVNETIQFLNKFFIRHPDKLKAIFVGGSIKYIEKFNYNFPIKKVAISTKVFSSEFNVPLPAVLLIDKNNLIHSVYRAESHMFSKQKIFIKKIEYLLKYIK